MFKHTSIFCTFIKNYSLILQYVEYTVWRFFIQTLFFPSSLENKVKMLMDSSTEEKRFWRHQNKNVEIHHYLHFTVSYYWQNITKNNSRTVTVTLNIHYDIKILQLLEIWNKDFHRKLDFFYLTSSLV